MTRRNKKTKGWKELPKLVGVIRELSKCGNVTTALKLANASRAWVYERRQTDLEFADAFKEARACGLEILVDEAHRRAHDGVVEKIFYQGDWIGEVTKYSDTLLMFLIKQADPSYREHYQIDHGNVGGRPFLFQMQLHPEAVAEAKALQS